MNTSGWIRRGVSAAAIAVALAAVPAASAFAGTNGQEISVKASAPGKPDVYLQVCGLNQNSKWVCTPLEKDQVQTIKNNPNVSEYGYTFRGWWFYGKIEVKSWFAAAHPLEAAPHVASCTVARDDPKATYWQCTAIS